MRTASISETKNRLSALLDRVRHGESILITNRRRLAEIVRVPPPAPEPGADIVAAVLAERRTGR